MAGGRWIWQTLKHRGAPQFQTHLFGCRKLLIGGDVQSVAIMLKRLRCLLFVLFHDDESMRLRQGELLAQSLCLIKRHGIAGILLQNFIKLHQGFGIIPFVFQGHAQI